MARSSRRGGCDSPSSHLLRSPSRRRRSSAAVRFCRGRRGRGPPRHRARAAAGSRRALLRGVADAEPCIHTPEDPWGCAVPKDARPRSSSRGGRCRRGARCGATTGSAAASEARTPASRHKGDPKHTWPGGRAETTRAAGARCLRNLSRRRTAAAARRAAARAGGRRARAARRAESPAAPRSRTRAPHVARPPRSRRPRPASAAWSAWARAPRSRRAGAPGRGRAGGGAATSRNRARRRAWWHGARPAGRGARGHPGTRRPRVRA